jgi:GTP-binding protein
MEIKQQWGPMVEKYLATRHNLVLSIAITDSRHEPSQLDLMMSEWLKERGKPFVIVATKSDKLSSNKLRENLKRASLMHGRDDIIPFSAITRHGADRLWRSITQATGTYQPI